MLELLHPVKLSTVEMYYFSLSFCLPAEFYIIRRDTDADEFLVLACDGVWDVMANEEICDFVADRMRVRDDLEATANEVIDTCLHKVTAEAWLSF